MDNRILKHQLIVDDEWALEPSDGNPYMIFANRYLNRSGFTPFLVESYYVRCDVGDWTLRWREDRLPENVKKTVLKLFDKFTKRSSLI